MESEKVKFLLNWNHFTDHLSSCMTKLMTDISYSDIIIATADKHMIYSHQFVLANSSKYFQKLLRNMKRRREIQLVVALPEIKYDIFKILMNYMYKGETQVPHELLPSVIKAGQFLEIIGLVNLSESLGNGSSTKENFSSNETRSSNNNTSSQGHENKKSTLKEKIQVKDNESVSMKTLSKTEKRTNKNQNSNEKTALTEVLNVQESGKENQTKSGKTIRVKNLPQESKNFVQIPLKRKSSSSSSSKDCIKKSSATSDLTSSSSSSTSTER